MNLEEFQNTIINTDPKDWNNISCWGAGSGPSFRDSFSVWTKGSGEFHNIEIDSHAEIYSLKSNLLISVASGISHNDDFIEEWANSFPDKHASSSFVDFFYSNQLVYRDIYVSVDGGRCAIPLPDIKFDQEKGKLPKLTVPRDKYRFFRLLNGAGYDYADYFSRTGIEIVDEPWMV